MTRKELIHCKTNQPTNRKKRIREDNKNVLHYYFKSNPTERE